MATQLRPFLTDIANAIRTKKGTTAPINAQNFASEIESISGGGSGGASLNMGWEQSTPIPADDTTIIQNIYFNTKLTQTDLSNIQGFITFCATSNYVIIGEFDNGACAIYSLDPNTFEPSTFYYMYKDGATEITEVGFSGWNPDFDGVVEVNETNLTMYVEQGLLNQEQLNMYSYIASIENNFKRISVELSGEYNPKKLNLEITENGTTSLSYLDDIAVNKNILTEVNVNVDTPLAIYVNDNKTLNGRIKGFNRMLTLNDQNDVYAIGEKLYEDAFGVDYEHRTISNLIINTYRTHNVEYLGTTIGALAYHDIKNLNIFKGEELITIEKSAFQATGFRKIELEKIRTIGEFAFGRSACLHTIVIQQYSCSLGADAFYDTPIGDGIGYIYVPDNAVQNYKTATNWSTYANQILPIGSIDNGWHLVLEIGTTDIGSGIKYKVNNGEFVEITSPQTLTLTNVQNITINSLNNSEIFKISNGSTNGYDHTDTKFVYDGYQQYITLNYDYKLVIDKITPSSI